MDYSDAFKILGLAPEATTEEIYDAYKALVKKTHPDVEGGNERDFKKINDAYQGLKRLRQGDLVPVEQVNKIILATQKQYNLRLSRQKDLDEAVDQLKGSNTSLLSSMKRMSGITGLASGGISLVSTQLLPVISSTTEFSLLTEATISVMTAGFAIMAFAFGAMYLMSSSRVDRIEQLIEDANRFLGDKVAFFEFANAFNWEGGKSKPQLSEELDILLSEDAIESHEIDPLLKAIHSKIGARDLVDLVIARGLERSFLIEHDEFVDGKLNIKYSLSLPEIKT